MGILTEAMNEQAFIKAGIFGNAGSGKTTTASYLAMAIASCYGNKKPVAFFETEAGSDFMLERFKTEGIKLLRIKSHSLAHLIEAANEAEKTCSVLIVDSITHVWNDLIEAKLSAVKRDTFRIQAEILAQQIEDLAETFSVKICKCGGVGERSDFFDDCCLRCVDDSERTAASDLYEYRTRSI